MTKFISLPAAAVAAALAASTPKPLGKDKVDRLRGAGFHIRRTGRHRAALIPADMDFSMTADHLVDDPREPRVMPTGVLDERGNMICRIFIPIKQQLGFYTGGNAWTGDCEEDVVLMQTADMIQMSDIGIGIESVDPSELEGDEEP